MKNIFFLLGLVTITNSCNNNNPEVVTKNGTKYIIENVEGCEYIQNGYHMAHKGNCSSLIHQPDTVYINAVQIRYGTRDTIFEMYQIDSTQVTKDYLKSLQK